MEAALERALERLRQRADFLAAADGSRAPVSGFVLQARDRREDGPVRVGFTVSRKVGNAVERNRVRRRLREVVRHAPQSAMRAGHDYVLIGRRTALDLPFQRLADDFSRALGKVHAGNGRPATPHAGARAGRT
jgi:ribonuclease P protein component